MSLTEQQCFEIALTLVKQHNKEDLLDALQSVLNELFPDSSQHLFIVSDNALIDPKLNSTLSEELELYKEHLYKCIISREPVYSDQSKLFTYPVMSQGKITNLIFLQGSGIAERLDLLNYMMTLFSNQSVLLDNNNHDALTGLLNRHSFESRMGSLVDAQQRRGGEVQPDYCFAVLDIDFFKRVNDDYGHLYGDEVLILFANIMENTFRHDDMLFRYGGEEFAVLLRNIDLDMAIIVLDRFRQSVEKFNFPQIGTVTVSIGVTIVKSPASHIDIISKADQALYYSKENGRNQVNSFEHLITEDKITDNTPDADDIELF